jgi:hypothetical protein
MKKYIITSLTVLISLIAYSGDVPAEIESAIKVGNASLLSTYFNSAIELTLLEKEGVYSKTQAEVILRNFFTEHPPKGFNILHQGGKESSNYAIGNYISDAKTYRITLFFKSEGTHLLIHQIRIENEYVE